MGGELTKAQFIVYSDENATNAKETITVLFNPSQYEIRKDVKYSESNETVDAKAANGGVSSGGTKDSSNKKNYVSTSNATLSLEVFIDTSRVLSYEGGQVKETQEESDAGLIVDKFMKMCDVDSDQHKPPKVGFHWGSTHFIGFIQSVSATYLRFSSGGNPTRAKVNLSLSESEPSEKKKGKANNSPDRTKARTIRDYVDVCDIAYREYHDPNMWKLICSANDIANPLDIPVGTVLKVPALD